MEKFDKEGEIKPEGKGSGVRSSKGKKPFRKGRNEGEGRFKGCRPNDYSWLNYLDDMLKTATQIPFGKPIGFKHDMKYPLTNAGIIVFKLLLTLGKSSDAYSPINLASKDLAASIRKKNSGSYNWEQADLAVFIGAFANALSYAGWMQRLVGRINRFNALTRYNGDELTRAEGVDYNDLVAHLPQLQEFIQNFCAQLNVFSIPKDLPILQNAYMAYRYDYIDINNKKVQNYLFTPTAFGFWNANSLTTGSALLYAQVRKSGDLITVDDIKATGQAMLDALNDDQDCYVMMGDIRKAYDESELMQVSIPSYPLTAPEPAVYSEEVLWQIKHIENHTSIVRVATFAYYQSVLNAEPNIKHYIDTAQAIIPYHYRQLKTGHVIKTGIFECVSNTVSASTTDIALEPFTFDSDVDSPSVEELVNDTRMKCAFYRRSTYHVEQDESVSITPCESVHEFYVVTGFEIYYAPGVAPLKPGWSNTLLQGHDATTVTGTALESLGYITQFRFAPNFKVNVANAREMLFGDITNFTTTTTEVINGIQHPVMLSLFHCPKHKA